MQFICTKGEASDKLIQFAKGIKNITSYYLKAWRINSRHKFFNFKNQAVNEEMIVEVTAPHTPKANSILKHHGEYINSLSYTMIIILRLPQSLQPLAVETAIYIANRLPE